MACCLFRQQEFRKNAGMVRARHGHSREIPDADVRGDQNMVHGNKGRNTGTRRPGGCQALA